MKQWNSFTQGCVLIGCGFKAIEIVQSISSDLQGGHVVAAGSDGIGFLALSRSDKYAGMEFRSIYDISDSFETPLWRIVLVDQCDSRSIDEAIEVCRLSRHDDVYLSIVVKVSGVDRVDYGMAIHSEGMDELRRLADAVLTVGRSAGNTTLAKSVERLVIALISSQGFGAHHFFHWCDIADLREVLRGNMLVDVRGVPYTDSPERVPGKLFEGTLRDVPADSRRMFLAVGGLYERFALEQCEKIFAAFSDATVSVFGSGAEDIVFVHAAYIDNSLKDYIEVVTCIALGN